jgi:hypothetical protein
MRIPAVVRSWIDPLTERIPLPVVAGANRGRWWSVVSSGSGYVSGRRAHEQMAVLQHLISPGDIVWDVGVHHGYVTLLAAAQVRPTHRAPVAAALTVMALGLGACGTPVAPSDRGICRHDSEFGTTGCADITGIVTDQDGRAQTWISVGPRFPIDQHMFSTPHVTTGSDGRFSLRVRRIEELLELRSGTLPSGHSRVFVRDE